MEKLTAADGSIFLRPMTAEDTDDIVTWRNREFVRRNFIYQKPFTREGHQQWTETMVNTGKVCQFMICLPEGTPIGSVYLRDIDRQHRKAEYGIFIGEEQALGKGYGTTAARLILGYAFEKLKLHKVMLRVLADNKRALQSYEKAGFVREALLRDEVFLQDGYHDVILMAVSQPLQEEGNRKTEDPEGTLRTVKGDKMKKSENKMISFVIPCYRSATTLPGVVSEIRETMQKLAGYRYEIVLVNDCSPDDTFETIRKLCASGDITGINLAKNFGQHAALMAGFHHVQGDIIVCLDDDGQTPACEVGKLLAGIEEGSDVVYARYNHKHHSGFRNFGSHINELMTRVMLGKPKELYVSSYFAARRFVVDEMLRYEYAYPYVIGLVLRTTRNICNVDVNHRDRESGTSGYTFGKLLALWFNGFTAFSVKPLRIATFAGTICALAGFAYGIYTIIKKIFIQPPDLIVGFSALMSVIVFMGGMLMLMMGLVGEYMGRMYISMNNSPQYVIREIVEKEASAEEGKQEK